MSASSPCKTCRQRKVKCDRRLPVCANCDKAGWKCPGYAKKAITFRDETARTAFKVRSQNRLTSVENYGQASQVSTDTSTSSSSTSRESSPFVTLPGASVQDFSITLPPQQPLEDLALCYAFSTWTFGWEQENFIEYRLDNGCLVESMRALGIARMLRGSRGPSMAPQARKQYVTALRLTNQALADPRLVKLDSTLIAVNLLGQFEVFTDYDRSVLAWDKHTRGAAALLELRGDDQFTTPARGVLYSQTAAKLIISSLVRQRRIPHHLWSTLRRAQRQLPVLTDPVWRLLELSMQITDFAALASSPDCGPLSVDVSSGLINDALMIDKSASDFLAASSLSDYSTVGVSHPLAFAGYCHRYTSFLVAQTRNAVLCYRLLLRRIVRKIFGNCVSPSLLGLHSASLAELCPDTAGIREMQLDIIASVPQHLGMAVANGTLQQEIDKGETWSSFTPRSFNLPSRIFGGDYLHWALHEAAIADPPGSPLRSWIIDALRIIGGRKGVKHALVMAAHLQHHDFRLLDDEGQES